MRISDWVQTCALPIYLLLAFFPAVVLGLAFGDYIEVMLENAVIVAWALVIGGFAILLVERFAKTRDVGGVANVSARQSILVGLVQCIAMRSEEHTSELQSLMRISYAVFCLKKKKQKKKQDRSRNT